MALEMNVTTVTGFTSRNAYRRVEGITHEGKDTLRFMIRSYNDASLPYFQEEQHLCPYDLNGPNPYVQAYKYIKTLPEFKSATDV
jgi:hypothetical protein